MDREKLIDNGFKKSRHSDESAPEYEKLVPVKSLSEPVRTLFNGTDVNESDVATVWVVPHEGVGITVWDCNAHYGVYGFDDPVGKAILQDAGIAL